MTIEVSLHFRLIATFHFLSWVEREKDISGLPTSVTLTAGSWAMFTGRSDQLFHLVCASPTPSTIFFSIPLPACVCVCACSCCVHTAAQTIECAAVTLSPSRGLCSGAHRYDFTALIKQPSARCYLWVKSRLISSRLCERDMNCDIYEAELKW